MPLMLRLRLLECLRTLALQVEEHQSQSEQADFWANRLITAVRHSSPRLLRMMEELIDRYPEPAPHFASELVAHLYDEEAALPIVSGWLERTLRAPILEVMQQEHRRQAVQQTSLAALINSSRRLAQIQWRELFEATNWAERELAADPAAIYDRQDFETRDRCRSAVEQIARWSRSSEQEIIEQALKLAQAGQDEVTRNIAYYLIDAGRPALEPRCAREFHSPSGLAAGCAATPRSLTSEALSSSRSRWWRRRCSSSPVQSARPTSRSFGVLLLLPASELAVLAVNHFVTVALRPELLPKMFFKKSGIPDDFRTLVVVPTVLTTPAAIAKELTRLEIR